MHENLSLQSTLSETDSIWLRKSFPGMGQSSGYLFVDCSAGNIKGRYRFCLGTVWDQ